MARKQKNKSTRHILPTTTEDLVKQYLRKKKKITYCPAMPAEGAYDVFCYTPRPPMVDLGWLQLEAENPMRRLARAKISYAFRMLLQYGRGRALSTERQLAERWLTTISTDLAHWCVEAGLSMTLVIKRAKEISYQRELALRGCRLTPIHHE